MDTEAHLIEERTQARAELFRAQERVRELEKLLGDWGEAEEEWFQAVEASRAWPRGSVVREEAESTARRKARPLETAVRTEAERIARARRTT